METQISTNIKISHNKPDILVFDKKKKGILIVELGITNQDRLSIVKNEKLRKYDLLANKLGLIHKSRTRIVPYVMTWDGVVTKYHKRYIKELEIQPFLEAYIQSIVLKKTLESISLDRRRGYDQADAGKEEVERAVSTLVEKTAARKLVLIGDKAKNNLKMLESKNNTTISKICEKLKPECEANNLSVEEI